MGWGEEPACVPVPELSGARPPPPDTVSNRPGAGDSRVWNDICNRPTSQLSVSNNVISFHKSTVKKNG